MIFAGNRRPGAETIGRSSRESSGSPLIRGLAAVSASTGLIALKSSTKSNRSKRLAMG